MSGKRWWRPCDSIVIEFVNKTGEKRSEKELDAMIDELNAVANKHDFGAKSWGNRKNMTELLAGHLTPRV